MQSIKQIKGRLSNKKNILNNVDLKLSRAAKNNNSILLKKLNQEKGKLEKDIKKLERELMAAMKVPK